MNDYLADGLIRCCGWCYPKDTIYNYFPMFKQLRLSISHGICPIHKQQMMDRVAQLRDTKTTVDTVATIR